MLTKQDWKLVDSNSCRMLCLTGSENGLCLCEGPYQCLVEKRTLDRIRNDNEWKENNILYQYRKSTIEKFLEKLKQ